MTQIGCKLMNYPRQTIPFPEKNLCEISNIESILLDYGAGKMVILVDDEARENEGDLLIAAQCVEPEHINFMATHGRGLICLSLSERRCRQLNLPLMVRENTSPYATAFTITIEAARNVSTGISAADRATTIQAAVKADAKPTDLVTPGHVFPIMAEPGGVLTRAGHTEAGNDLAKLCGFEPASVLCEILNPDGTMARLPQLLEFSKQHKIKIGTIADLIRYRLAHESTIHREYETQMMTEFGEVRAISYVDNVRSNTHLALVVGDIAADNSTLLRVHVFTGLYEVLDSIIHGHASWSVRRALKTIVDEGTGAIIILNYQSDFSGITTSFAERIKSTEDEGNNDLRIIGIGSQIAADLGFGRLRVLGHPVKMHGLSGFGLEITEYLPPTN